ncbi:hypothetical protein Nepgr_014259 [Nepenthes gracilis]|uniref:Polygalacturonase-inhibiting protein n=1 Tax=Nepenthes gracilis TaxID=150966 RepID=A0AAD3XPP4_NEPGR|nr:hypothetical protein Nepgr_014259 [Nepenthes gracilis]
MLRRLCSLLILSSLFFSVLPTAAAKLCNSNDNDALLEIQEALGNPPDLVSAWQLDTDCCTGWAIECNSEGRVTYFFAFRGNHPFQIPPVIGNLTYLQGFNFIEIPSLTGTIPESITLLRSLERISISWTNLSGHIPSFLGQIPSLKYIYLNDNKLSGVIPPSLGHLPNLTELNLSENKLTGGIPRSLGSSTGTSRPLSSIVLAFNQLSGPIPRSLGYLNIAYIDLSGNNLVGDASFLFGANKTALWYLNLGWNSLSFNFSDVKIPSQLSDMVITNNKIYGRLPPSIAVPYFEEFNVSYNQLCGPIPTGGSLQLFDSWAFSHNKCLCGIPLPPCQ